MTSNRFTRVKEEEASDCTVSLRLRFLNLSSPPRPQFEKPLMLRTPQVSNCPIFPNSTSIPETSRHLLVGINVSPQCRLKVKLEGALVVLGHSETVIVADRKIIARIRMTGFCRSDEKTIALLDVLGEVSSEMIPSG